MKSVKWYSKLLLSVLSGLIWAFSWYPHGIVLLSFVALIPLLYLSDLSIKEGKRNAFGRGILLFYPAFFVFNFITTYWIAYCTLPGAAAAVILNALLQTIVFSAWHACRKHLNNRWLQAIILIGFWAAFEYLHLNWDLTWPWLNLGNVFAEYPQIVQWYSVTGTAGGTIWILSVNILIYKLIRQYGEKSNKQTAVLAAVIAVVVAAPVVISLAMRVQVDKNIDQSRPVRAVIVQQNTDPWFEEYSLNNSQEIDRILDVAGPFVNANTDLVITPESSIAHGIDINALRSGNFLTEDTRYNGFQKFDSLFVKYPNLNFVLGLSTFRFEKYKFTENSREVAPNVFSDYYNTAGFYNASGLQDYYHKSRLVPGVEKMPFPKIFGFLGDIMIKLGGSNASLGCDTVQSTFFFDKDGKKIGVGVAICYESIYGELVGNFVKNGAGILAVITNDSWWKDSQGHIQHFEMARLRAVETRRYVLRAANGGFSGVIDPAGRVLAKTEYDERTAIETQVCVQDGQTFYVKHGDYLYRMAVVVSLLGLVTSIISAIVKRILDRKRV